MPIPNESHSADGTAEFLKVCNLTARQVDAAKIEVEELRLIWEHHTVRMSTRQVDGDSVMNRLRVVHEVHSVRQRVKSPARLVEKVVLKRAANPNREISLENYANEITDLVGLRALHLFKEDWPKIHEFIQGAWDLVEKPKAYVRKGDPSVWIAEYEARGCTVEEHPRSYRSVHYLVPVNTSREKTIAEIQVRTLSEEAWSEIDHRINYPHPTSFQVVRTFLLLFNRLAGMADEMGSFVNHLEAQRVRASEEQVKRRERLNAVVAGLPLTEVQRRSVREAFASGDVNLWQFAEADLDAKSISAAAVAAIVTGDMTAGIALADLVSRVSVNVQCEKCREWSQLPGLSPYARPYTCAKCLDCPGAT